jgi:beta-lactamase regulating signal transducer with metallopeptidase domain/biopolymer transport protein ExbD
MSAGILSALLAANLAASAAILLVVLIRKTARRVMGARLAYWLWAVPVLAGLATLLPARDAGTLAPAAPIQPIAEATINIATSWAKPAEVVVAPTAVDVASLLAVVWVGGVLYFLALMLMQQGRTLRALKLAPGEAEAPQRAASNFGPAVIGVLKPLLVVPMDFEQRFSQSEQALVLAHEDVHLEAGHTRINAALVVLTSLNWFNPLVHWAAKLARDDQELACDATVLERFPRERGVYAEALLKTQISRAALPLGCTWPSRSSRFFKERMTMLANKTPGRARRVAGAAFIAVALLGAGCATWGQKSPAASPFFFAGAVVKIDKNGYTLWDGKAADSKEALAELAKDQATSSAPHIWLETDAGTQYFNVARVIQAAQSAGVRSVGFFPSQTAIKTPTPPPGCETIAPKDCPALNVPGKPGPVRIFVDFDGGIFWNGVFLDRSGLDQNLQRIAKLKITPEVHIEPHRQSSYGQVDMVIGKASKAGLDKLAVIGGT